MQLTSQDYAAISEFLESQAGIRLGVAKEYLVSSRLVRLLETYKLASFADLVVALKQPARRDVQGAVIDAMTTNETFWFRDVAHYSALTSGVLKDFSAMRLRIWSAAASTGQEAYSIAISLQDAMRSKELSASLRYEILGTDISPTALRQAREARYCGVSASRGLSDVQRNKYFRVQNDCIELKPEYKQNISFRDFNLLQPYDSLGRFDVVFCRNVLIYFSQERKREIIERFARCLNPGGYLFIGSTESMHGCDDLFEMKSVSGGLVYQKRN